MIPFLFQSQITLMDLPVFKSIQPDVSIVKLYNTRVLTSSGNHGKPGKSPKKVPCMEKSWNLKKPEKSWKVMEFVK